MIDIIIQTGIDGTNTGWTLASVLIAYTALIVTIVGGILAFLVYQFFPVKSKQSQIWNDLYGKASEEGEFDERERHHEELMAKITQLEDTVRKLSIRLAIFSRTIEDADDIEDVDSIDDMDLWSDVEAYSSDDLDSD